MKPYSILIFDWDGTLMDSEAHITQCMRNAIAIVGRKRARMQKSATSLVWG